MSQPLLAHGARIAVVAPAHAFNEAGLALGEQRLREWGYQPVRAPNLSCLHRYSAGTVAERAADLNWALSSPDVDAVWFARGGSGTGRLLEHLDWDRVAVDRPVFGFSDATALFCGLRARGRGRAVHAPVLHSLVGMPDDASVDALFHLLSQGASGTWTGRHLVGPRRPVQAPVVGGNLCVLASLAGSPWQLDARGCILLLEDIGEAPYKIDRLLFQLQASGQLRGIVAVGLGQFVGCEPPAGPKGPPGWDLHALLAELLAPLDVPVLADLPFGHGAINHPFVWGAGMRLQARSDA